MSPLPQAVARAAEAFGAGQVGAIEVLGQGLINDTYLVRTASGPFVLQRINHRVFPEPAAVMANLRVLTEHVAGSPATVDGWRLPAIIPTRRGEDYHLDAAGNYWRAISFIADTHGLSPPVTPPQAEELGRALGRFHAMAEGLDPARLLDTLPGLHVAPAHLAALDAALARVERPDTMGLGECLAFVEARRSAIDVLESARATGRLRPRTIHGDPKLDNVLFCNRTGRAVSLIDLDTVKPGLLHYDVGDCLRSSCNRAVEGGHPASAVFDTTLCQAILRGYFGAARDILDAADLEHFYDAIRLLPLELGIRFLTDHLAGDVYFKVAQPGQNLRRARLQFRLAASAEAQEATIRRIIEGFR